MFTVLLKIPAAVARVVALGNTPLQGVDINRQPNASWGLFGEGIAVRNSCFHQPANVHDEKDDDGGFYAWKRDVPNLAIAICAVDLNCFVDLPDRYQRSPRDR